MWIQLLLWVISFVLTDYFRERLPSQTPSGIGDFNIPTATEGRVVPIITGGTVRVEAPNCIFYSDFVAVDRTVTTGIIFKKEEVIGFRYELALQYALFKGESAGITGIWIGDDKVFDHVVDAAGIPQEFVDVDRDDLFGGTDSGGGFQGRVRLHKGTETQAVSAFLASRLDPLPAYRGLSYVMITNIASQEVNGFQIVDVLAETKGATIGESNQLRYIRVEVQTFDDLAGTAGSPGLGNTLGLAGDTHFIGPDINPMIAAWDKWANTRWGEGFGLGDINIASFRAAAQVCFDEGIGWTNLIDEVTTTGAIQDSIEQHVDGYIGPDPLTGQIIVTLARPDYVLLSLPLVDESNLIELKAWDQGDWSNTKNRIRIRYTSRSKDWKETHAVETAAGNRIIQGRTVSEEIRFVGCHTDSVASIIARREKRGLSIPLQKGTIVIDRTGYTFKPGQVFRFTSAQAKVADLPVRVSKIGFGDMIRQSIEVSVVEDIFGNEPATVTETPPESDFVPPIQAVIPFVALDQAAAEPPFILQAFDEQPGTVRRIVTWAHRAPGNNATFYEVHRRTGNPPAGAFVFSEQILASFGIYGTLRNAELGPQAGQGTLSIQIDELTGESLDGIIATYDPRLDDARGIAVISPGQATEEWIIFTAIVDSGTGIQLDNVSRSAMDTAWKAHLLGAPVWFIWTGGMGLALETYALDTQIEVKLLPGNSEQVLAEGLAAPIAPIVRIDTGTDDRTTKPLLPVTLDINGTIFPATVDFETDVTPQSGPNYFGAQVIPAHRLATVPDVRLSVEGQNALGAPLIAADLTDQVLDTSYWLHNLDEFPAAARVDAVDSTLNAAVVNPNDELQIEKADLVAGGVTGLQFNARLEIETRHSPVGGTALNISHEPLFFDFIAEGVFSLEPSQLIFGAQFNGQDTDAFAINEHAQPLLFEGNAQIDEASSQFGGSSLILDGTGDHVWLPSPAGFDWYDIEWTIDFRIRFDDIVSAQTIIGQWTTGPRRQWYLEWDGAAFQLRFSRSGSDGPFTNIALGAFAPNAGQWYALRIVQKKEPTSPRFSCYIDGTRTGTTFTAQSHSDAGTDWLIGARYDGAGVYALEFTGQIDELEVRPFAAIDPNDTSYTVEVRPGTGPAGAIDTVVANFEDVDTATDHRTDDSNRWNLTFGATSQIDTAQFQFGASSLRCDGVNSLTPASADGVWIPDTLFPTNPLKAWDLKKKDFTMEAFVRYVALPSSTTDGMAIITKYNRPSGNSVDWLFWVDGSDNLSMGYWDGGNIASPFRSVTFAVTLAINTWYHFAAVREGDRLSLYFDGNRIVTDAVLFTGNGPLVNNTSNPVGIGRLYDASVATRIRALNGFTDGVRVHVGSAIYSGATYTVPTTPPAPGDQGDRDLLLLHHFEGVDFFATDRSAETDDGQRSTRITFEGGSRYLDADPKFGVTHGDADLADGFSFTPSLFWWDLADGDFTIDIWYMTRELEATQVNGGVAFFNHWLEAGDERGWRLSFDNAADRLEFIWTTLGTTADERTAFVSSVVFDTLFPLNTYVHVAVERQGSTLSIYVDGVLQTLDGASASIGADVIYNPVDVAIRVAIEDEAGGDKTADAFWDEFRITKVAAYGASSFTPEVAAYPDPIPPNV